METTNGVYAVLGEFEAQPYLLRVSRSIGDAVFKKSGVICEPDVLCFQASQIDYDLGRCAARFFHS